MIDSEAGRTPPIPELTEGHLTFAVDVPSFVVYDVGLQSSSPAHADKVRPGCLRILFIVDCSLRGRYCVRGIKRVALTCQFTSRRMGSSINHSLPQYSSQHRAQHVHFPAFCAASSSSHGDEQFKMKKRPWGILVSAVRTFALHAELEQIIFNYIIKMQELRFGLTVNQVKVVAFKVAEASGYGHVFNTEKKCGRKKWWTNFKQHYGLTLRYTRASMANPPMVDDYFDKLTDTMAKLNIQTKPEDHVYGKHEEIMTLVGCRCANGIWIQRYSLECGFQERLFARHSSPSVREWLKNKGTFFNLSTADSPRPILLLMDSQRSHITPDMIEPVRSNDLRRLTFPSHTTHILQPLDIDHPTEKPNKTNFYDVTNVPFVRAMWTKNIKNAFRRCGIVPLNRDAIPKGKLTTGTISSGRANRTTVNALQCPWGTSQQCHC
ncbi:hypothetical protein PR048_026942 [Dryococelus australis]|uniref:DDE-1 domain-containing protein n=1 Tax=Dryococelus australis TaxID=614101 RepID=A0ABQ9GMS1_9NEOP|nr:hypothetical protein PR048_026942 [Dryococelus australis]